MQEALATVVNGMYTLLIVDDEPNILEGIRRLLDWEGLGFGRIETAKSVSEVMSHILDLKPDVCVMDVCIGNDMGYELISCLNNMGVPSNYIMMSGYDEFHYAREALRCGALDYLLKPVRKEDLLSCVKKIIVERLNGIIPEENERKNCDPVLEMEYEAMSPLIRKIIMMVRMEYGEHISLKSIADKFRMNSTYLGQIFIKETGMKFSEYLMCYRLTMARERILNSNEKIAVIAGDVGYSNMNYFYQQFHNYYQMTPSEMRQGGQ